MSVSIIIPTLNEYGNIADILHRVSAQKLGEIIVVDGHSTDGTVELVEKIGYPVIFQEGKGLGKAIEAGIKASKGDIVIIVDADGSHDPQDMPKLLDKINEGFDLVIGSRYSAGPRLKGLFLRHPNSSSYDDTFIREFGNRFFTYLCRKLFNIETHDVLMGFKAFRRKIFEKVKLDEQGQQFDAEILIKAKKAGFRIGEVPVIEHKRKHGRSN